MNYNSNLPSVTMGLNADGDDLVFVEWSKIDETSGETTVKFYRQDELILNVQADELIALAEAIKAARREDERLRMIRNGKG